MILSFGWPNMKAHPIIPVALILLVYLSGCAARMAQQEIDTLKEQIIAIQQAAEFMRLDRLKHNSKCRGAEDTFKKLDAQTAIFRDPIRARLETLGIEVPLSAEEQSLADPRLRAVLDYLRHARSVRNYMEEKHVTAEQALTVLGDLALPPQLPPEIDPFNGCILDLGSPPDKPATYQAGKLADGYVFYWQSRDWRETQQAAVKIYEQLLQPERRTPFVRFVFEYSLELTSTLNERAEKGETTLLQAIKAFNAGGQYLSEQARQYGAQLRENLIRAKAQDDALLGTVAVGLGVVATAAASMAVADANYRIANAETARATAAQAQARTPIRCVYTPPGRYGPPGYINCY